MAPPRRLSSTPTLAHGPRQANDLDRSSSGPPQGRRARGRGGSRRIDVVDEDEPPVRLAARDEEVTDVRPAVGPREPGLPRRWSAAGEQPHDGQIPAVGERVGEPGHRDVSAVAATLSVSGHERDRVDARRGDDLLDERGERLDEVAPPSLLPPRDERPCHSVVDDRGPRLREGEPPPRTFDTPANRPCAWAAAPLAHRRAD